MASYELTEDAREDIDGIYEYSILTFGLSQARTYISGLHDLFSYLADSPRMGRDFSHIKPDIYRFEYQSHSVYYQIIPPGIRVMRVLHRRMDAGQHL